MPSILKTLFAASAAFLLSSAALAGAESRVISHTLNITVDIEKRTLSGIDTLTLKEGTKEIRLVLRRSSSLDRALAHGKDLKFAVNGFEDANEVVIALPEGANELAVHFHGEFPATESARENLKRGVAFVEDGTIGPEGAFMPSNSAWFPQEDGGISFFDATVSVPEGYSTVMEGELVKTTLEKGRAIERWKTEAPLDGLDLVAGRYIIEKERLGGIDIYTYLFEKDPKLSRLYMDKTKEYLGLYQDLIGPYPFKKFAVVENFLPTGYGMPSFTLLGSTVIRLPFIPDTSLGHEIAHSWWGNSVFVDNSTGNWVEALTTYTADYLYARRKGAKEARDFRLSKLRGYKNYAGGTAIALKDFIDSTAVASRAVGYNKGVMVFNMLERAIGTEAFKKGLKGLYSGYAFKKASWADIRKVFEAAHGKDLGWFFEQWVERGGGPVLSISDPLAKKTSTGYTVGFKIRQPAPAYAITLPALLRTESGEVWKDIDIKSEEESVSIELKSRPLSVEIDPDNDIFRVLDSSEIPPSFASVFGDPKGVIIAPAKAGAKEKYSSSAELLSKDYGLEVAEDSELGTRDVLKGRSALILGGPGENTAWWLAARHLSGLVSIKEDSYTIKGKAYAKDGVFIAITVKKPEDPSKVVSFFMGDGGAEKVLEAAKRLRYFSEYSYAVFREGGVDKGTFEAENSLKLGFTGSTDSAD